VQGLGRPDPTPALTPGGGPPFRVSGASKTDLGFLVIAGLSIKTDWVQFTADDPIETDSNASGEGLSELRTRRPHSASALFCEVTENCSQSLG
jgi:hypothetical protein